MNPSIKQSFPSFSNTLIDAIDQNANEQFIPAGTVIMRTGQYIKNTMLVISGKIKIYREDEDGGEFFMYYFFLTGKYVIFALQLEKRAYSSVG